MTDVNNFRQHTDQNRDTNDDSDTENEVPLAVLRIKASQKNIDSDSDSDKPLSVLRDETKEKQAKTEGEITQDHSALIRTDGGWRRKRPVCSDSSDSDSDHPESATRTKQSKKALFHSDEDNDSNDDPVFKIQDTDANSSDSEFETIIEELKNSLKKRKVPPEKPRNKNWKKKPTTLNKRKRTTPGWPIASRKKIQVLSRCSYSLSKDSRPTSANSLKSKQGSVSPRFKRALQKAKEQSIRNQRVFAIIQKHHEESLDSLLSSNGLQRQQSPKDGNCFFQAVINSLRPSQIQTHMDLREKVCNYMSANRNVFTPFLSRKEIHSDEDYTKQVDFLRKDGNWSSDLSDALPLATANVIGKDLKIFTSDRKQPIIYVKQTNPTENRDGDSIVLCYIKMRGMEHYDSCHPIGSDFSPIQTPTKENIEGAAIPEITPRKQAQYHSPEQKRKTRRRKADPESCKKNIRKKLRSTGKNYISSTGKHVKERSIQMINCSKCRYKCTEKISTEQRQHIFETFWELASYERQKDFLCSNVKESTPKRILLKAKSHRSATRLYTFLVEGHGDVRVCKAFFLKTLDISQSSVDSALKGKDGTVFVSSDKRGKHAPHNKISETIINDVRRHIESFPTIEAHYTRKDTKRKYLGHDLSIEKMYDLYKEKCKTTKTLPVSRVKYRQIFCDEYNLSFHKPKKDQCQTCAIYEGAKENGKTTPEMDLDFSEHLRRKQRSREEKEFDKTFSKHHSNYHSAVFDLQAVLPVPCSLVSQVYYKRKLNCYNLSVYSLQDGQTSCYVWNESEGKRGSCEISTCLQMYLRSLPDDVSHVSLFSDSCPGQNRNRVMAAALLNAVEYLPNINVIDQKFLEPGHTQMEVDSVHAAIERAKKATSVFVPSQWDTVIRLARKKRPYSVIPLKYSDFLDFKSMPNSLIPSNVNDCTGQKVLWMQMKWIQYRKRDQGQIFFKYEFDSPEFKSFRVRQTRSTTEIRPCYTGKLPIPYSKKADLLSLCKSGVIPDEFHLYYDNMKSQKDNDAGKSVDTDEECD